MSPRRPPSIRASLTLALGTVVAALIVVGLVLAARAVRSEARTRFFDQYNRLQLALARQAANTIEERFESFHRNLNLAARLLRDVEIGPKSSTAIARELQKVYDELSNGPVAEFVVFDRRGVAVAMAPYSPHTIGRDFSWRVYFQWARDRGAPGRMYVSPFMEMVGGIYRGSKALMAVEGLFGPRGEFRGVVGQIINFDALAKQDVLSVRIGENGYAWLLDNNNRTILVDPRGRVSGLSFEQAFLPRWSRLYAVAQRSQQGVPGTDWYDYEDPSDVARPVRKLVGFAPVRVGERLWTIGVCTPVREAEATMGSLLKRQTLLTGIAIGVTLAGALGLSCLLLTWNRSLSREVAERTRELTTAREKLETTFEELLDAKKLAALGGMSLRLAHEIRNPLTSIRMNIQRIQRKIDGDDSVSESFAIVEEEILRLNHLVNNVMGFARPVRLRLEPTDLRELVHKALSLLGDRLEHDAVAVQTDFAECPPVLCDPDQIRQVLLNLLLNAIEAMADKSRPRSLSLSTAAEGKSVCLRVVDTGKGISPGDLERVFDPFFSTKTQGGGLGLSIAKTIVLRHGGTLQASSTRGEGAAFVLCLPVDGPTPGEEKSA